MMESRDQKPTAPLVRKRSLHVSIHGHEAAVHDRITRRTGSFVQAMAGLDAALGLRDDHALRVTMHSTISALNVEHLPAMIEFFLSRGVDHYGLNGLFIEGLAVENVDLLEVSYDRISKTLAQALEGPHRPVSVSDIPPCRLVDRVPSWAVGLREVFHIADVDEESLSAPAEAAAVVRSFAYGPHCAACAPRFRPGPWSS